MNVMELCKLLDAWPGEGRGRGKDLIKAEVRTRSRGARRADHRLGREPGNRPRLVRLFELDGVFGIAALGSRKGSTSWP